MSEPGAKSKPALGFLTVIDHPQQGLFGGYLVLNITGRPVEFHCTAPIKPNRAQEILYGPTLEPYLFGEQIGQALLGKSDAEPLVVCTDREPALAVRQFVDVPVALVLPRQSPSNPGGEATSEPSSPDQDQRTWRLDAAHRGDGQLYPFQVGCNRLACRADCPADGQLIAQRLAGLDESFDLSEPFTRIREAIEEARRGG